MKIIIDTAESSVALSSAETGAASQATEAPRLPDLDGGVPSEALLSAVSGRSAEASTQEPVPRPESARQGSDAGAAPTWLVDVIEGSKA